MKLSTKRKYMYFTLAIILIFTSISSSGYAWGKKSGISIRPLSFWTENNPSVFYGFTTNWDLLPEGYIVRPTITDPDQYSGYVIERILDDGRVEYTVVILGNDVPIPVYSLQEWFNFYFGGPFPEDIFVGGSMDCLVIQKFILPDPVDVLPFFFDILIFGAGEWLSTYAIGYGSGEFSDHAGDLGFETGITGHLFLHQYGYIDSEGVEVWPKEIINIY